MRQLRGALVPFFAFTVVALTGSGCLDRELRPIVPCVSQGFVAQIQQNAVDKVDLLFVVDDSPSMAEEQASLATQIPHLITVLTTGDTNGDGMADFPPVTDMHAGVITVNMGVAGIPNVPTCMRNADFGDDGILLTVPRLPTAGCMASYPHFLAFTTGTAPMQYATDFTCLARTGTGGCGFEQQLDAPLKALLPNSDPTPFAEGTHGNGDQANAGFLRDNSLIVVFVITDEDDCSTDQTDIWNPASAMHSGDLNLRCINYDSELYPVSRFITGLKSLRPMNPNLVIFATITGVPEDLVTLAHPGDTIDYSRLFADPRMMNHITVTGGTQTLDPACAATGRGSAAPGIRMAKVAQGFGDQGVVQSICSADYGPALDVIIAKIANALGNVCLPRKLNPDSTGRVGCTVVEVLDPSLDPAYTTCADIHGVDPVPARTDADGKLHCTVNQVPVDPTTRASGNPPTDPGTGGWYYDDYTATTLTKCAMEPQRIVFFDAATGAGGVGSIPPSGVTVDLECLQRVQGSGGGDTTMAAQIGTPCTPCDSIGTTCSGTGHEFCDNGGPPSMHLQCEANARVCQIPCVIDSDCPTSFACFSPIGNGSTSPPSAGACPSTTTNSAYPMSPSCWCVNPICI